MSLTQKINFKFYELSLPDDDPVFTLKNVMEEMDFTALLAQYSGKGKSGFNPIMKYGVLTYANMRGIREVDRIVGKSKLLDFTTNPNLGEIQTFYGKADKFSFCRIKSLDFILYIFQIYYHRMQEVIS